MNHSDLSSGWCLIFIKKINLTSLEKKCQSELANDTHQKIAKQLICAIGDTHINKNETKTAHKVFYKFSPPFSFDNFKLKH